MHTGDFKEFMKNAYHGTIITPNKLIFKFNVLDILKYILDFLKEAF